MILISAKVSILLIRGVDSSVGLYCKSRVCSGSGGLQQCSVKLYSNGTLTDALPISRIVVGGRLRQSIRPPFKSIQFSYYSKAPQPPFPFASGSPLEEWPEKGVDSTFCSIIFAVLANRTAFRIFARVHRRLRLVRLQYYSPLRFPATLLRCKE